MAENVKKLANGALNIAKTAIKTKFNIATIKIQLIAGGVLLAGLLLTIFILGAINVISNIAISVTESNEQGVIFGNSYAELSPEVLAYREDILKELKKENKAEYVDILLALMMQESGGRGNDPMQASESKCGYIGCITSPKESIRYGVKHFLSVLEASGGDIQLTLQSYNFGSGFINYVKKNGGSYTYELAVSFSQMMYEKLKHQGIYVCHRPEAIELNACYGDILYVQAVMRYANRQNASGYYTPLDLHKSYSSSITSRYGWRNIGKGPEHHNGVDYACTKGVDRVYAVTAGTVAYAGQHKGAPGYGNFVTIKHNSTFYTTYAHLDSVSVSTGDNLNGGETIGICGNTGRSTGPHLHFETKSQMWRGYYDPEPFVQEIIDWLEDDDDDDWDYEVSV